ncbi:Arm DNA-binding domain-containing protein [Paraburkholderia sediminicola]|uniref:Arm DNA-binding domain-containing protein n=1 Tax=Paraburkholderia sediminicola TaxID=458836 RepID=UPI0038BB2124
MPKRIEPKSEVVFRVAKPRERPYLFADGNGLALRIWPDGSKTWLLRYRRPGTGKENFLTRLHITRVRPSEAFSS